MPQLSAPLFRLPIRVDVDRLVEEVRSIPDSWWVPDRLLRATRPSDYRSLGIVTHRGGENDIQWGPMAPSPVLARLPYVRDIVSWFEAPIAEVRLRELGPSADVWPHFDSHYALFPRMRFHIPIWTHEDVWFGCDGIEVRMRAGEIWLFDRLREHWVRNESSIQSRMHLIIDTIGSPALREKLEHAEAVTESGPPTRLSSAPSLQPSATPLSFVVDEAPIMTAAQLEAAFNDVARLSGLELPRHDCDAIVSQWRERETADENGGRIEALRALSSRWVTKLREGRAIGSSARNVRVWLEAVLATGAIPSERFDANFEHVEQLALRDVVTGSVDTDGTVTLRAAAGHRRTSNRTELDVLLAVARRTSWSDIEDAGIAREDVVSFLRELGAIVGQLESAMEANTLRTAEPAEATLELRPSLYRRARRIASSISNDTPVGLPRPIPFLIAPGLGLALWFEGNGGLSWCDDYMLGILSSCGTTATVGELAVHADIEADEGLYMTLGMLAAVEAIELSSELRGADSRGFATIAPRLLSPSALHMDSLCARGFSAVVLDQSRADPNFAHVIRAARRASLVPWIKLRKASRETVLEGIGNGARNFIVPHVRGAHDLRPLLELDGEQRRHRFIAVVEDLEGLDALDEIAALPGVEGLMLGPTDFERACAVADMDPEQQLVLARGRLRNAARTHGKWWGWAARTAREAHALVQEGARFIVYGSDIEAFDRGMQSLTSELEQLHVEV